MLTDARDSAGMPISDKDFIKHYNKCLRDLSSLYDTAKFVQEQTIICEDPDTYFPLLDNCIGIKQVLSPEGYGIKNYKIKDGRFIKLFWRGTYTVREYILHTPITSMVDNITINPAYERCIPLYIAAQIIKKTDKESHKDLLAEFTELAGFANSDLRKVTNKNKTIKALRFW
jgi:hypothetical protein